MGKIEMCVNLCMQWLIHTKTCKTLLNCLISHAYICKEIGFRLEHLVNTDNLIPPKYAFIATPIFLIV